MPALNQRFKSSCDYRVPASGWGADHVGILPHSTDFSHSRGSDRVWRRLAQGTGKAQLIPAE